MEVERCVVFGSDKINGYTGLTKSILSGYRTEKEGRSSGRCSCNMLWHFHHFWEVCEQKKLSFNFSISLFLEHQSFFTPVPGGRDKHELTSYSQCYTKVYHYTHKHCIFELEWRPDGTVTVISPKVSRTNRRERNQRLQNQRNKQS